MLDTGWAYVCVTSTKQYNINGFFTVLSRLITTENYFVTFGRCSILLGDRQVSKISKFRQGLTIYHSSGLDRLLTPSCLISFLNKMRIASDLT